MCFCATPRACRWINMTACRLYASGARLEQLGGGLVVAETGMGEREIGVDVATVVRVLLEPFRDGLMEIAELFERGVELNRVVRTDRGNPQERRQIARGRETSFEEPAEQTITGADQAEHVVGSQSLVPGQQPGCSDRDVGLFFLDPLLGFVGGADAVGLVDQVRLADQPADDPPERRLLLHIENQAACR